MISRLAEPSGRTTGTSRKRNQAFARTHRQSVLDYFAFLGFHHTAE